MPFTVASAAGVGLRSLSQVRGLEQAVQDKPADSCARVVVDKLSAILITDVILSAPLAFKEIAKDVSEGAEPENQKLQRHGQCRHEACP